MIPRNYKVTLSDGTESKEFAYSPVDAVEMALIKWVSARDDDEPPGIKDIAAVDDGQEFLRMLNHISKKAMTGKPESKKYKGILKKED